MTSLSRREFIKTGIAATTAATVGLPVTQAALAQANAAEAGWKWDKSVCRFCGVGCGEQVATFNGKVVAIKGDPDAPVNRGLNCIKGYFNGRILYGEDRLTRPLMRMKDGKFDKNGDFVPVTWTQAFDEMERQFKRVYKQKGPAGVAMLTSGQSLVQEGYVAAKLMKAGFRSNNIDPNARLCMASAVVAFIQTFGIDEPANIYDDIEYADTMVLWGANMAEAHPILWSRVTDRKLSDKANVKIINVTTYRNMSSDIADLEIVFKPNTDLAIMNYINREIIARNAVNTDFVNKHCVFATGPIDIGYGMRPTDKFAFEAEKDIQKKQLVYTLDKYEAILQGRPDMAGKEIEQKAAATAGAHWHISFDDYKKALEPYTLDLVAELAKGDPDESLEVFKKKLKELADACITKRNLVSFWTMGANQHVRGVWVNELFYAMHLLQGKHGFKGNGAFSLTGQPSACGTAREVGTFAHRLPADMVVDNPGHRERTSKLWNLPTGTLNPKIGTPLMIALRGLEDGSVNFVWTQTVNLWQSVPNTNHWLKAAKKPENFIVVSDSYPTLSGKVADLILPTAMILEKWGMYGNAERRMQCWRQMVDAPGEARADIWIMLEFAKRFKLKEVWGEQPLPDLKVDGYPENKLPNVLEEAKKMGYNEEMTLYDALFATPTNKKVAWPDPIAKGGKNSVVDQLGENWFIDKALFEEYRKFTVGHQHDLASFDAYYDDKVRGLRWPIVDGKETLWRFSEGNDPYVKAGEGFNFYGPLMKAIPSGDLYKVTDPTPKPLPGKAKIFYRPYAAYPEQPDNNYDLLLCTGRILEHWHTGSMTRRVPELHRAAPTSMLYMHPADADKRKLKHNDVVWLESRRGKIKIVVDTKGRNKVPKGTVSAAFFDEAVQTNQIVIDAADPISLEPDYKKSAVKVYKA
ncbi:MAG: nitrate reductase catalytic subunit NapA [Burkholderiales bacterium]|jgi:nitrate reductase NapA|nr:nitrate reductase catalytic subunit NapA [Burkholderiales bacterium]